MGYSVRVEGGDKLRRVAAHIRATGNKGLGREMSAGLRSTLKPLQQSIRASADRTMPRRGGYRATFAASLKFRSAVKTGARTAQVELITFASGAGERRDIEALEAGKLRHPHWGRSRPGRRGERIANDWSVTSIPPGFHRRGTEDAADLAERQMLSVLDDFTDRLMG